MNKPQKAQLFFNSIDSKNPENSSFPLKVKRNISLKSSNNNISKNIESKVLMNRSVKKMKKKDSAQNTNQYISKSFNYIEKIGCFNEDGTLNIDGDYGDYRMKLFRKKDQIKHYNDPKSIFDSKEFSEAIFQFANCGLKGNQNYCYGNKKVNSNSMQQATSPTYKNTIKTNKIQKARIGLKRQNSILSPGLKDSEAQFNVKQANPSQNSQLNNKIMNILLKPKEFYLTNENNNQQNKQQEQKNALKKGVQQQLRQKQGHLFYRSIPQYMAQKWFKTLDNSTPDGNDIIPYIEQPPKPKPPKKRGHKRTHLFRFLEQNCQFNINKKNKSTMAY